MFQLWKGKKASVCLWPQSTEQFLINISGLFSSYKHESVNTTKNKGAHFPASRRRNDEKHNRPFSRCNIILNTVPFSKRINCKQWLLGFSDSLASANIHSKFFLYAEQKFNFWNWILSKFKNWKKSKDLTKKSKEKVLNGEEPLVHKYVQN